MVGQILDYAKDLAAWSYEDLQRQISLATGRQDSNLLYQLVSKRHPRPSPRPSFVDNVRRHLQRGEFLLLIVGDGIREGVEKIVDFVQRHSGLHFNLALVEAALYRDRGDRLIMQPRVLARTEIVQRFVVDAGVVGGKGRCPMWTTSRGLCPTRRKRISDSGQLCLPAIPSQTRRPNCLRRATYQRSTCGVSNSGFGGWALSFTGYINRNDESIGCFVTCRKGHPPGATDLR